ncbi:outer membrane protein assembly factor BamA [Sphingomonas sp.]|uniref:outer membrane protein assembly factor BamA n=1 Tax=Sphingomonas sp. TaxID=28214 RepID=UPI003B00CA05
MAGLLIGTILGVGAVSPADAQRRAPRAARVPVAPLPAAPVPAADPAQGGETIRSLRVSGNQRLEPETVLSYVSLRVGQTYTRDAGDTALKALYATDLFADVQIVDDPASPGAITIKVRENPVVNRVVLEGNKRLKSDKIMPEIKLQAREIFSRAKVRADVARIIELYRRQGRYAATVDPQMVLLDQNRVDVVFEIHEGDKSKVKRINIIGNAHFADSQLKGQMATKESNLLHVFSGGTSYDPDRLAYDQQKLRQFYLTQGYADFRVVSAVAELTPDKKDFVITYVVDEGQRYKFGKIDAQSDIRDLKADQLKTLIHVKQGDWYNAKAVEDTVDTMTETAGALGYAFADIRPEFDRNQSKLTMGVNFHANEAPRVYVERIDIAGNSNTQDKVVRREFRLQEGDAFNGFLVKRSRDRIRSLGFFQDKFEVDQKPGSAPDRVVLQANVEEKSTGQLQVSAGYSSLEKFIVSLSIEQSNFRGKGQTVRASADYSAYSKSLSLGFTEPYLFDKNLAFGGDVYRRDFRSFNYTNDNNRNTTYNQTTTGFQLRLGVPLTEYWSLATRYTLNYDDVTLDRSTYYLNGVCSPIIAGQYLCDAIGKRVTSSVGYSIVYDTLNNRITPTAGNRLVFGQDVAGLGGSVKYLRNTATADNYRNLGAGFVLNTHAEGGYIWGYAGDRTDSSGNAVDAIRLTDRFYLGQPQIRGFDIRGVGPRIIRYNCLVGGTPAAGQSCQPNLAGGKLQDDALGGRAYYVGHFEVQVPLGSGAREAGFKPSIFVDAGSVFGLKRPRIVGSASPVQRQTQAKDGSGNLLYCTDSSCASTTTTQNSIPYFASLYPAFQEVYYGSSISPRVSVGFGVSWNSPFGPLRIDIAKALVKQKGDDTKLFSFNVGTQF